MSTRPSPLKKFQAPPYLCGFLAAWIFLTRIPLGFFSLTDEDFKWSTGYFPLIGAFLGLILGSFFLALTPWSVPVRSALVLVVALLLTGAFHEDGLADTADALGGAFNREKLFVILKDSRVGTFGASALFLALLLRFVLLSESSSPLRDLLLTQGLSRLFPVWLMALLPYVSADGKSKQVALAGIPQALLATFWSALILFFCARFFGVSPQECRLLLLIPLGFTFLASYRFLCRAGGVTGDFLGATQQLAEIGIWLALVAGPLEKTSL